MAENKELDIKLSVLDIERKYKLDFNEYSDTKSSSYIKWGEDNQLPLLFKNCYQQSATLKSVIDGTINYILGDDIIVNDSAAKWSKKVNRTGMSMRELIAKTSFNLLDFGGFAIQVIYNKLGVPVELFPLDFSRIRLNESGTKVYYAKKWSKYQSKFEEYDIFNPDKINPNNPTQIYVYKGDLTLSIYPMPPYAGAIYDVLTEVECAKYSLNTVANGFSAKYIINFPEGNNLTDEQKEGIKEAIKNKFTGSESESNFMLYWADGEQNLQVEKIEGDESPERFIAIKDNARQNIFIAMRCTPVLFGLPNVSNGFSVTEYRDSFALYQKGVVAPYQDIIIEAISKVTFTEDPITIKPFEIDFETGEVE